MDLTIGKQGAGTRGMYVSADDLSFTDINRAPRKGQPGRTHDTSSSGVYVVIRNQTKKGQKNTDGLQVRRGLAPCVMKTSRTDLRNVPLMPPLGLGVVHVSSARKKTMRTTWAFIPLHRTRARGNADHRRSGRGGGGGAWPYRQDQRCRCSA